MFETRKIDDSLVIISERDGSEMHFCMQLVIGTARAVLIDSGLGYDKSLLSVIRKFTSLPVSLYVTHGHGDHAGNAALFDDVHLSSTDAFMVSPDLKFTNIKNGEKIDLGGIELETFELKGHTDGCFVFLNKKEGYALTGDSVNQDTWLCWNTCQKPHQYAETLKNFNAKMKEYGINKFYDGHTFGVLPQGICEDMITALEQISTGQTDNDTYHHTEEGKEKYQHLYGNAKIIYDKETVDNLYSTN